jgi:hypothetical protein
MTKEEEALKVLIESEKKLGLKPGTLLDSIQKLAEFDEQYVPLAKLCKEFQDRN